MGNIGESRQVSTYLSEATLEKFSKKCSEQERSMSWVLKKLIEEYLGESKDG